MQLKYSVTKTNTIADELAMEEPGKRAFEIVRKFLDEVFVVANEGIKKIMLFLLEREKILVEQSENSLSFRAIEFQRQRNSGYFKWLEY